MSDLSWMDEALCTQADPESFFPGKGGTGTGQAKRLCMSCPVRASCEVYAAEVDAVFGRWGVWAGKAAGQRPVRRRSSAERDRGLFEASERARLSGQRLVDVARDLGVSRGALEQARSRARKVLAAGEAA